MDAKPTPIPTLSLAEQLVQIEEDKDDLERIIQLLLDPNNIAHNTELTRNEITAFSVLGGIARKYKLDVLQDFLNDNLSYRVSKGRAGRKEWVKMIAARALDKQEEEQPGGSKMGKFFRRK